MDFSIDWDLMLRLFLATFFGCTVGAERYTHGRPAGLRTYLLVCVAFASIAILSEKLYLLGGSPSNTGFRPDPGRLMAGGLTGIGFLGAGIIIQSGGTVHGLTTAAALWAVSVVGLAVGSGHHFLATTVYLLTLLSLIGLRYLEPRLKKDIYKNFELCVRKSGASLENLEATIQGENLRVTSVGFSEDRKSDHVVYYFTVYGRKEEAFHRAYREFASRDDVQWMKLRGRSLV